MKPHIPQPAYELHANGHRAIAAWNWRPGSYLKLSGSLLTYSVHGQARGQYQPSARDHVPGVRPYHEYFQRPVWVAVRVEE